MLIRFPVFARGAMFRCLCVLLAAAIVFQLFYLGAKPVAVGLIPEPWDKLAHLVVFGVVTVLLWIGMAGRMPLAIVALVIILGALDEWHQAGLPGRAASMNDFLVDVCAGIGAGLAMWMIYPRADADRAL